MGRVGEVHDAILLQSPGCHCRIHQRVVKVQLVYGEGHSPVQAAYYDATPAVIIVLVSNIDDDAAVSHLHGLQRCRKRRKKEISKKIFLDFIVNHPLLLTRALLRPQRRKCNQIDWGKAPKQPSYCANLDHNSVSFTLIYHIRLIFTIRKALGKCRPPPRSVYRQR